MSEEIYVVVKTYIWDKDDYICAYLDRADAEAHRDRLNGEPYDVNDCQDHTVWTIPLGRECLPPSVIGEDGMLKLPAR